MEVREPDLRAAVVNRVRWSLVNGEGVWRIKRAREGRVEDGGRVGVEDGVSGSWAIELLVGGVVEEDSDVSTGVDVDVDVDVDNTGGSANSSLTPRNSTTCQSFPDPFPSPPVGSGASIYAHFSSLSSTNTLTS